MSLAICLRRQGITVDIVELDPAWRVYGAGITITGASLRALDQLLAAPGPMPGDIQHQPAAVAGPGLDGQAGQLLQGIEHLAVLADQAPRHPALGRVDDGHRGRAVLREGLTRAPDPSPNVIYSSPPGSGLGRHRRDDGWRAVAIRRRRRLSRRQDARDLCGIACPLLCASRRSSSIGHQSRKLGGREVYDAYYGSM